MLVLPKANSLRAAAVVCLLVVSACSGSGDADATSTTISPETSTTGLDDPAEEYLSICHDLELLEAADVNPGNAAVSLTIVNTGDMTSQELAQYGAAVTQAPIVACPELVTYGESVSYWLGF